MTAERSITDVLAGLRARHFVTPRRELHVSEHVGRFLRETYASAIDYDHRAALMGSPITVQNVLEGGQWRIYENEVLVAEGDMAPAPEGMRVIYSPISGWLAVRRDLVGAFEHVLRNDNPPVPDSPEGVAGGG